MDPGAYRLRLVLSEQPASSWQEDRSAGIFAFDSARFVVDAPPRDGRCLVFPPGGTTIQTGFRLGSLDWIDDDLPLRHRFAWREKEAADPDQWTRLSPWSQTPDIRNVIFGKAGVVVV